MKGPNLNGWQRAWIVAAVIWAAIVMFVASFDAPNSPMRLKELKDEATVDQLLEDHPRLSREELLKKLKDEARLSREELLAKQKGSVPEWDDSMSMEGFRAVNAKWAKYDDLIKHYPHDIALYVVNSAAVWAAPLIVIYLLGLRIAWVRSGFKQKTAEAP